MTTLDHSTAMTFSATRPAVLVRAVNAVANFLRAWKNRRAFQRLGEMTDYELADIGLRRADLHAAVGLPFGADPTAHLTMIVQSRIERSPEETARLVA